MRTCVECGKEFVCSTGDHRRCAKCQAIARRCVECGKIFKGAALCCHSCRSTERTCDGCGRRFTSDERYCNACRSVERVCKECGAAFEGRHRRCLACRTTERNCKNCGAAFRGTRLYCNACQARERVCIQCGEAFKGHERRCAVCRTAERNCVECGQVFRGVSRKCDSCKWKSLPPDVRRAKAASNNNGRRARKRTAQVAGPVPPEVYEAIRVSGPCVYCGEAATTVDHVRPLARGGWEHESNLVPACGNCNFSKRNRLLTEWRRSDRVAYGVEHSPKVAAEYERLTSAEVLVPA